MNAIFVPTWRCNLRCPYCDYRTQTLSRERDTELRCFGQKWMFGPELSWRDWLTAFDRLGPMHLEITGGEPLMYSGLVNLTRYLRADSTWAITSNTLLDVQGFVSDRNTAWTASYHYRQKNSFVDNVRKLQRKGFHVRVTLVFTPENAETCREAIELFAGRMRIGVNLHPVLKQGFDWREGNMSIYEAFRTLDDDRMINFVEDVPVAWEPQHFSRCEAGGNYITLMPDGTVLRCYSALLGQEPIGHVSTFTPRVGMHACGKDCIFPCDRIGPNKET